MPKQGKKEGKTLREPKVHGISFCWQWEAQSPQNAPNGNNVTHLLISTSERSMNLNLNRPVSDGQAEPSKKCVHPSLQDSPKGQ